MKGEGYRGNKIGGVLQGNTGILPQAKCWAAESERVAPKQKAGRFPGLCIAMQSWQRGLRTALAPLDLGDLVSLGAAGRHDFDRGALFLADQRTRQRRGDGDAALLGVGLRLADDLPDRLLVGVFVDQRDGGAELDGVA